MAKLQSYNVLAQLDIKCRSLGPCEQRWCLWTHWTSGTFAEERLQGDNGCQFPWCSRYDNMRSSSHEGKLKRKGKNREYDQHSGHIPHPLFGSLLHLKERRQRTVTYLEV